MFSSNFDLAVRDLRLYGTPTLAFTVEDGGLVYTSSNACLVGRLDNLPGKKYCPEVV